MGSKEFWKSFYDTVNNKRRYFPVIPINNQDMEIGTPENLIIVIPDFDKQIWDSSMVGIYWLRRFYCYHYSRVFRYGKIIAEPEKTQ
jgi:hypothetical protein